MGKEKNGKKGGEVGEENREREKGGNDMGRMEGLEGSTWCWKGVRGVGGKRGREAEREKERGMQEKFASNSFA